MKKFYQILLFVFATLVFFGCGKSSPGPKQSQTTDNGNTTGNTGTSGSTGTARITITDVSPQSAKPASEVTIHGTGFGSDVSKVRILINNEPYLDIVSVTPTAIVIKTNLATASGKITVVVNGTTVNSTVEFTALLADLKIISFSGSAGQNNIAQLGHEVYLYADGFGTDTNKIFISFGGTKAVKANYIGPAGLALGAFVPRYAEPGSVTLTVGDRSVTSTLLKFELSLKDFTPKSFSYGDTVKITGLAFTTVDDMFVDFNNGKVTKPYKVTETEMWVVVPYDAQSGYLSVSPFSGNSDALSDDAHKYTFVPTVSFNNTFTPGSGKVGDLLRINGDFEGAAIGTIGVSFNGSKPVQPSSITGADLFVKIPADAKTGAITISRTGYKSFTGKFIFTIVQ